MQNILAFDIETIPNIEGGRILYGLGDEVAQLMRENLSHVQFTTECGMVGSELDKQDKEHFNRFLDAWKQDTF